MLQAPVNILLVEDSPSDAALLQECLTQNGLGSFRFARAESLAEAIQRLRNEKYDVLLLDLSLPDSQGPETFLRARAAAPDLPVVVLTGIEDEAVGLEAVRHGIQDYLIKGQAHGRQTARAIRYAIERKRAETALKQAEADLQLERSRLEERVAVRTAELSGTNQVLKAEIALRQRMQEAHQQVLRRLSEAEETERGRFSRELHDRLGQQLTALKLGLQMLRQQGPFAEPALERIAKLETMADGLMRDIRHLAWELRPSALDDLGLEQALQRYATEWSETSHVPLDFHCNGGGANRLPQEFESTLYRVAQEALTNIVRHAHAQRVSLLLERRPGSVSLIVEDDGRGFDVQSTLKSAGAQGSLGLLGMQERVNLVGGVLEVESSAGAGTTIFVRLPLEQTGPAGADVELP